MAQQSAVWLKNADTGAEIHFSGITQVRHNLSLKVASDPDSSEATDYINGARRQPAKVTLSLAESDAGRPRGSAARMLAALEGIRGSRNRVTIYTNLMVYNNMLLSDLTVIQEEGNVSGWTGTATFVEAVVITEPQKANDNSSTVTSTGTAAQKTVSNNSSGASAGSAGKAGTQAQTPSSVSGSGSGSGSKRSYGNPLQQVLERSGIKMKTTNLTS